MRDLTDAWEVIANYDAREPEEGYLPLERGDFVQVDGTGSDMAAGASGNQYDNYVYVKALDGSGRRGWVPRCVLKQ